jgi:hypothetical protein
MKHMNQATLGAVFLLALAIRLAYIALRWPTLPDWSVDALGYHQLALNLLEHGVFSLDAQAPFQPDAIRVPAYPLFLALVYRFVGIAPRAVIVVQACLDALTALLTAGLAFKLTRSRRVAFIAGAIYAVYQPAWLYCAQLYVESALASVVALVFLLLVWTLESRDGAGRRAALALGVLCAVSLLIKPNVVLLPMIVGMALWGGSSWRRVALFGVPLIVLLAPWVARNALVFGRPMLSSVFENNLARVSAPATLAEARGEDVAPWTPRWEMLYEEVVQRAARAQPALFSIPLRAMTPRQSDAAQRALAQSAREIIAAHPRAWVTSHIRGALHGALPQSYRFWFEQLSGQLWENAMPGGMISLLLHDGWRSVSPIALALFILFTTLYTLGLGAALVGLCRLRHKRVMLVAMTLFIVYMLILPGPIAYERFRVPVAPLLCVLMGCAAWKSQELGEAVAS